MKRRPKAEPAPAMTVAEAGELERGHEQNQSNTHGPALVGYATAAHRLGIPIGTVRSMVSRGQIPHVRMGDRLVRFDVADLDAWIAERRVAARGPS